jgi:hypothetical protein
MRYWLAQGSGPNRYNKVCGAITKLTSQLKSLKVDDEFRIKMTQEVGLHIIISGRRSYI